MVKLHVIAKGLMPQFTINWTARSQQPQLAAKAALQQASVPFVYVACKPLPLGPAVPSTPAMKMGR